MIFTANCAANTFLVCHVEHVEHVEHGRYCLIVHTFYYISLHWYKYSKLNRTRFKKDLPTMLYCLLQCGHFLNTCWIQVGSDIFRPNLEHKWIVTSEQPPQETLHCHDRLLFYFFLSPAAALQTAGWLLPNLYITYYNTKKDAQIGIGPIINDRGKPRVFNKNTSIRRGGFFVLNVGALIGATRG